MELYTLSTSQRSIWLFQQGHSKSPLFNIGGYAVINDNVDFQVFYDSFCILLKKHPALRLRIVEHSEGVSQYVSSSSNPEVKFADHSGEGTSKEKCQQFILDNMKLAFDMDAPLYECYLLKQSDHSYYWYLKLHHIIADGYSLSLVFNEMSELHSGSKAAGISWGSKSKYSFTDLIRKEEVYRHSVFYQAAKQFWLSTLTDPVSPVELSKKTLKSQPSLKSYRKEIVLARSAFNDVCKYCAANGISVFNYLLGCLYILVSSTSQTFDFTIGIPVLNRSSHQEKQSVGPFFNVIPCRFNYRPQDTVSSIIHNIKRDIGLCLRNMHFPILDLIEALQANTNLYNITFSYQKIFYQSTFNGNQVDIVYLKSDEQMNDLDVHVLDFNQEWDVKVIFDYKIDFLEDNEAAMLLERLKELMMTLPSAMARKIYEIVDDSDDGSEKLDELGTFTFQ